MPGYRLERTRVQAWYQRVVRRNPGFNLQPDAAGSSHLGIGTGSGQTWGAEVGGKNDGLIVSLVGIGVPEGDAENYEKLLIQGHFMVIVECSKERSIEAQHVLEAHPCVETRKEKRVST